MFERIAGEAVRESLGERLRCEEIPVFEAHDGQRRLAQLAHCEVDAFDQEPLVLVVAIDDHQLPHAVACELAHGIPHRVRKRLRVQAGGAGEVLAAAAFGLRLVAIAQGGSDQARRSAGNAFGNGG